MPVLWGVKRWWALQKCNYVFEELIIVSIPVIPGRYPPGIKGIFYCKKKVCVIFMLCKSPWGWR